MGVKIVCNLIYIDSSFVINLLNKEKRTARSKKRRERYPKIKDKINAARRNQYKQKKAIDH
jgi:hypothetical protein